jgi:hypothetical protein
MSNSANTLESLNGMFKKVYNDQEVNLIPDGVKLLPMIPFSKKNQIGELFSVPLVLKLEHGVTFAVSGDGAFALNAPISGATKEAQVQGTQMLLRSALSYSAVSRSVGAGEKAFKEATKFVVENMLRSMTKKLEIMMIYGQVGYGVVSAAGLNGNSEYQIDINEKEWAPGIWAGAEGLPLEIRTSNGATSRGVSNVLKVDYDNRAIVLDTALSGVIAGDVLWHKSAYGKEFAGIHKIISNTGSLFGISADEYSLWKGNTLTLPSSTPLSFSKLQDAVGLAAGKGLDKKVVVLVNPDSWADLMNQMDALRHYDSSYSKSIMENGAMGIKFYGQNGEMEIQSSIFVKRGYAYGICADEFERIGSTDITFKRPGKGDDFFRELENNAGYELRSYSDQCVFSYKPGINFMIANISNG